MTEKQIQDLVRKYRGLDSRMLALIARAYEEGGEESPESLLQLPYEVQEEMYDLMDEVAEEAKTAAKEAYIAGYERDKNHDPSYAAFLRALPLAYFAAAITPMGRKAHQDTEKFAQQANHGMRISWSRAQSDAVNRAVEAYNKGGMTWMQAKQKALNELADSGVTHFLDKAGRSWDLGGYVEMGVRTGIGNSSRAGFLDSMTQRGKDLVFVSSHYGSCPLCAPWQGVILSISGNDPNYPSLQDAINGDLFHPNCKHVLLEYIEGVSVLRNDDSAGSREYYDATQKQRHYERNVRKWKNRTLAAITPEEKLKAQTYLSKWDAALKSHIETTGVPRRSYRESVPGFTSGDMSKARVAVRSQLPKTLKVESTVLQHTLGNASIVGVIPKGAELHGVTVIAGNGVSTAYRNATKLSQEYGGSPSNWQKKSGIIRTRYYQYEVHWDELFGMQYEAKLKRDPKYIGD